MKKGLLLALVVLIVTGLLTVPEALAQQRNVTFVVNSATVPDTVKAGYIMQIRGGTPPLTWDNATGGGLTNIGGDYWSTTIPFAVGTNVHFKIFAGTDGWEQNTVDVNGNNDGNRSYIVADRDTVLEVQYFNNGPSSRPQYFRPWSTVPDTFINVYFRVNMLGADQVQRFNYADSVDGDSVGVRGGGPAGGDLNWSPTFYLTKEQPASNGGFTFVARYFKSARVRIPKSAVTEGQSIEYKYLIGSDWGRDELQGQPNRSFNIPIGKKDTTISWKNFDNITPSTRVNADTVVVTYIVNMTKALNSGGFSTGDTVVVRSGYFSTAGAVSEKRVLLQVGASYQARDTIVTSRNNLLDYQYYLVKNGTETRENYYNFDYVGELPAEAERRQVLVPAAGGLTVRDTATSITNARRQPDFANQRRLNQNVLVRWEVDLRPAYYQVLSGDTLYDIQGTFTISHPDSVYPSGVWINGPATNGWATWGASLRSDTTRKMWDNGTNGDQVANDSIFTRFILASPDSFGIGTKGQIGQVYKFGIKGGDNEGGRGGFGNNHATNISDATGNYVVSEQWGAINPAYYDAWDFDLRVPRVTGVRELPGLPTAFDLTQNYPNPFNPTTNIEYVVPSQTFVTLKVYNLLGQEVATLVNGVQKPARYVVDFNANRLASGIYFYTLTAGQFVSTKKMVLMK